MLLRHPLLEEEKLKSPLRLRPWIGLPAQLKKAR